MVRRGSPDPVFIVTDPGIDTGAGRDDQTRTLPLPQGGRSRGYDQEENSR